MPAGNQNVDLVTVRNSASTMRSHADMSFTMDLLHHYSKFLAGSYALLDHGRASREDWNKNRNANRSMVQRLHDMEKPKPSSCLRVLVSILARRWTRPE